MTADHPRRWRRTPKFILRAGCIADLTAAWDPGRFLEVGAGTGTMTRLFLDRNFRGVCHDIGEETRSILRDNLADYGDRVSVAASLDELSEQNFDYVFAFEVLEHIEDDVGALELWTRYLRPGGGVLLSVPAHQRKYGRGDRAVGHIRRYEKEHLRRVLHAAGYVDTRVINYGFPVGNITRWGQALIDLVWDRGERDESSTTDRSISSGIESSPAVDRFGALIPERAIERLSRAQRYFYENDLGDGYVAKARKPVSDGSF